MIKDSHSNNKQDNDVGQITATNQVIVGLPIKRSSTVMSFLHSKGLFVQALIIVIVFVAIFAFLRLVISQKPVPYGNKAEKAKIEEVIQQTPDSTVKEPGIMPTQIDPVVAEPVGQQ